MYFFFCSILQKKKYIYLNPPFLICFSQKTDRSSCFGTDRTYGLYADFNYMLENIG